MSDRAEQCASVTPVNEAGNWSPMGKGRARCEHDKASHAFNVKDQQTGLTHKCGDCLVNGCPCKGYVSPEVAARAAAIRARNNPYG